MSQKLPVVTGREALLVPQRVGFYTARSSTRRI